MATIADATLATSIADTDLFVIHRPGTTTDYRVPAQHVLTFSALDYVILLKAGSTNTIRHAGMIAGANPIIRIHGTRSSGLTVNDTIRVLMSMSNAGNSPIDYAAIEAGVDGFNGAGRLSFYTQVASGSLTERVRINSTGGVSVATLAGTGTRSVYSDASGYLTNTSSDARLKTDVEPIAPEEALDIVTALEPVRYNWRDQAARGEQREIGLIAQQVQAVAPEVVGENDDGMLSLDYARLAALLAGAVQAQAAQIDRLEKRLAALEGEGDDNA